MTGPRTILVSSRPKAAAIEAAQSELVGANFAEVADRHSDCAGNGGNLGLVPRGEMVQEFEDVIFALKPGETSAIFRSPFGFHIAHVSARFPEGFRAQNDVTNEIRDVLLREKQERALEQYLDKLRAGADVRIEKNKEPEV